MGAAAVIGLAVGALSAFSGFSQAEAQRRNQEYQSKVAANNAQALRNQAVVEQKKGEIQQQNVDREREKLRRDFGQVQGRNTSMLAASNVQMDTGSAAQLLEGNAANFASDIAQNRYNYALTGWEAQRQVNQAQWQAAQYDSQSSWLKKTAGSLGNSLLAGGVKGVVSGLGVYSMAGGSFGLGGGDTTSLFADGLKPGVKATQKLRLPGLGG